MFGKPSNPKASQLRFTNISPKNLHKTLKVTNLKTICSNIRRINYQDELVFEQMLITDNMNRTDLIIIDRQVSDRNYKGRIDLLALKQIKDNEYHFLVIEVKMGNNIALQNGIVAKQLDTYVKHIQKNFNSYKICYEENYKQKHIFGLIKSHYKTVNIVPDVHGMILVGGYSQQAAGAIKSIQNKYPELIIQQIVNRIGFSSTTPSTLQKCMLSSLMPLCW